MCDTSLTCLSDVCLIIYVPVKGISYDGQQHQLCNPATAPSSLLSFNSSPPDKMAAILQTTFSNAFSWMKMLKFWFNSHWIFFTRVQLTINQHWFRDWLVACAAPSHYLNQCWPSSPTHICGTRGRGVKAFLVATPAGRVFLVCDGHHQVALPWLVWCLCIQFTPGNCFVPWN